MKSNFPLVIKKQNKEVLFQIDEFSEKNIRRYLPVTPVNDYFFTLWIKQGKGKFMMDEVAYNFEANTLLSFVPGRPFVIRPSEEIRGVSICFHSDFYCMDAHAQELGCSAAVFNNIYSFSLLRLSDEQIKDFAYLEQKMTEEMQNSVSIAREDVLVSYLKILLINISRIRLDQIRKTGLDIQVPATLLKLQRGIELNFRKIHAPFHYAEMLNVAPNSLNKMVKKYYNKTLTQIIQERIISEAKKELYQSNKPIKNIAFDLGFTDALYFSRLFKKKLRVSPESYRRENA